MKGVFTLLLTILALSCTACGSQGVVPLSDPAHWNGDFMDGAQSTPDCPTDTITNARNRMTVAGPYTVEEFEKLESFVRLEPAVYKRVSDFTRKNIEEDDAIYDVQYLVLGESYLWGFFGYVVAKGDCIVHVGEMGYIN